MKIFPIQQIQFKNIILSKRENVLNANNSFLCLDTFEKIIEEKTQQFDFFSGCFA